MLPTTASLGFPAGLTSKPHHAHGGFAPLTWIVLPATGIDFQPQTRPRGDICNYRHPYFGLQSIFARIFHYFMKYFRFSCKNRKKLNFFGSCGLSLSPHPGRSRPEPPAAAPWIPRSGSLPGPSAPLPLQPPGCLSGTRARSPVPARSWLRFRHTRNRPSG